MPYELEIKAQVDDFNKLFSFLSKSWNMEEFESYDIYYKHPCKTFSEGEELRLRFEKKRNSKRYILTYKVGEDPTKRLEIESEVSGNIQKILSFLGFDVLLSKKKRGYVFRKGNMTVTLSFVEGEYMGMKVELGWFIELEIIAGKQDEEVLKKIEKTLKEFPGVGEIDNEYYIAKILRLVKNNC